MFLPELVPGAIVAAAIAPALLLLWLTVCADSRPEPPRVVWIAVILGALSAIPTGFLELQLMRIPIALGPWLALDVSTLLFVGIPEETVKIAIMAAIALRARDFDEPMDGVVYGTAVGLGFAAVENLLYLVGAGTGWEVMAVTRGILSVPFHGALGAIAGAYIARARFGGVLGAHGRWRRPRLFVSAWLIPVVLHSVFDASLFSVSDAASTKTTAGTVEALLFGLVAIVVGFGTIVFAVLLARRIARHQKPRLQTKRLAPAHWRGVWAESLFGVGLSFVGLSLAIAGNSWIKIAGLVLLAIAVGIARKSGRYLREAAKYRRHSQHVLAESLKTTAAGPG